MVMHPQEVAKAEEVEHENCLWWEMDKIVVRFSNPVPEGTRGERLKKAEAAGVMMTHLHRPTHEWCRAKFDAESTR